MLSTTEEDLIKLGPILDTNPNFETPKLKLSIYKNRRGSHTGVYLWASADLGTCRVKPQFCTNWRYEPIPIEDARIIVEEEDSPPWEE